MENASKALIMAAGVLIALIILGALILMFNNLSNYQKVGTQNQRETQVIDFNKQYETYNRKNVRGSDLYSLINRVVDYNRRKSTEGTGKDEGQYLGYQPMTIEFTIDPKKLTTDDINRLITTGGPTFTISSTKNTFSDVLEDVTGLEETYGKQVIQNLSTARGKIFIDKNNSDTQKKINAIISFNTIIEDQYKQIKITSTDDNTIISRLYNKLDDEYKEDDYKYSEYVQFKRARFDCEGTEYYNDTGRIRSIKFKFNGKFE